MTVFCTSPHCTMPGQHQPGCPDEHCRGCQPALAMEGARLCGHCRDRLGDDAMGCAVMYEAMVARVGYPGQCMDGGAGTREPGLDLDPEMLAARDALHAGLSDICRRIVTGRSATGRWRSQPPDAVLEMAVFIVANADWMAEAPYAHLLAMDLRALRTHGDAQRFAFRARRVRTFVGTCPFLLDGTDEACEARLYTAPGEALITCPRCTAEGTVEQWQYALTGETRSVCDAYSASARLSVLYRQEVTPVLVRRWAHRGHIITLTKPEPTVADPDRRVPLRDLKGRALYEWRSVLEHAERRMGVPVPA